MRLGFTNSIGIEAIIESARGLETVSETAGSSERMKSLVFGVADYSVSIGARLVSLSGHGEKEEEIYAGHRWNFVLSRMVMAASGPEKYCRLMRKLKPGARGSIPGGSND
jgi:citrate lyase beta subunit